MKAAAYDTPGGPEVLLYQTVPDPLPGAGEILIRVEAIPIEGGDVFSRRVGAPKGAAYVVGYQAGGVVVGLGEGAGRFRLGDRVATFNTSGSHAALRAVPETLAWPIPAEVPMEVGACIPTTFSTADDALFALGRLQAGESVLINGAGGGVGVAAVQLAHAAGATVIGTASSDDTLEKLKALGLTHAINHRTEAVDERVLALTGGVGADLVLDMAGGQGFEAMIRATRRRGRLVSVGAATGQFPSVSMGTLIVRELTVSGFIMTEELPTERVRQMIARHMAGIASGALRMPIAAVIPLSEAAAAHRMVENDHPFGRVVMRP